MALSAAQYRQQLQALLPPGPAWSRARDAKLTKVLDALAAELARIDQRAEDLLNEIHPLTARELLSERERECGLPDPCLSVATGIDERRRRLHQRLIWRGGQSRPFYIALLATLGYPGATITEFRPMRVTSKCNAAVNGGGWCFAWRVNVPVEADVKVLKVTGRCNEPLAAWGDPGIYCLLNRHKQAHTDVFVSYGENE